MQSAEQALAALEREHEAARAQLTTGLKKAASTQVRHMLPSQKSITLSMQRPECSACQQHVSSMSAAAITNAPSNPLWLASCRHSRRRRRPRKLSCQSASSSSWQVLILIPSFCIFSMYHISGQLFENVQCIVHSERL